MNERNMWRHVRTRKGGTGEEKKQVKETEKSASRTQNVEKNDGVVWKQYVCISITRKKMS